MQITEDIILNCYLIITINITRGRWFKVWPPHLKLNRPALGWFIMFVGCTHRNTTDFCICTCICMLRGSRHCCAFASRVLLHHIVDFLGSLRMETAPMSIEVILRPTLVQSGELSDLRGSMSPHDKKSLEACSSVYSTWWYQAVTHPIMDRDRRCLTSVM